MRRNTLFTILAVVLMMWFFCGTFAAAEECLEFLYTGDCGPGFWAEIKMDWEACDDNRQSPIDIKGVIIDPSLKMLDLELEDTEIDLINNGHTIEQLYEGGGKLNFEGVKYELLQFHFHTPSEHTVGGQHGVMELHAVFQNIEDNSKYAVIGMLYSIGSENPFLQELINAGLPRYKENETFNDEHINLADGLTETSSYYTYKGSLTTPPCSETVTWIVLKQFAKMSEDQFQKFRQILGNNFRPLQERNAREVRATARRGKGLAHWKHIKQR